MLGINGSTVDVIGKVVGLRMSKVPGADYMGKSAGYADLGPALSLIRQECRQALMHAWESTAIYWYLKLINYPNGSCKEMKIRPHLRNYFTHIIQNVAHILSCLCSKITA